MSQYIEERLEIRNEQARTSIILSLIVLNAVMLGGGAWLSFYLAKRTLLPIRQAMEKQNQFVSDASHELRTPLTALQTINEVALRKKQIDKGKARSVFSKNIDEIRRLHELTEMMLMLSQAEDARATDDEDIQADGLLHAVMIELAESARAKKIALYADAPAESLLHVPAAPLRQVLVILGDNTIKYSPPDSSVTFGVTQTARGAAIAVADSGVGIAKQDVSRLFDRFYRADTARTRSDVSGYGLGLSIAKAVCDREGWSIAVESQEGIGSTFTVEVPTP